MACCAKGAPKRRFFTCRDYEGRPHLRLRTLLQVFSHRTKLLFAAELVHQQPVYDHTQRRQALQRRKVKSFPRKCQISKCSEKKKSLKLVPLQPRNCALRWEIAWLQDQLHSFAAGDSAPGGLARRLRASVVAGQSDPALNAQQNRSVNVTNIIHDAT